MTTGIGDEIAWYCPSLDDSGNGTTTLNDLSGNAIHGTLSDMDAASDWPADTNNGGTRALDFDGADDQVTFSSTVLPANTSILSLAYWVRRPTWSTFGPFFGLGNGSTTNRIEFQPWSDNLLYVTFSSSIYGSISLDQNWHHYVAVYDGTATGNQNRLKIYRDGIDQTVSFVGTIPSTIGTAALTTRLGRSHGNNFGAGRADDMRIFNRVILASEVGHIASQRATLGAPGTGINQAITFHRRQLMGSF